MPVHRPTEQFQKRRSETIAAFLHQTKNPKRETINLEP
jgi:hypothetical protein